MSQPDALPTGVVSLLFSDVEGSTRLVRELGDAWADVLTRQRELCRAAWAASGGHELGTEGDSFFVAFDSATAAVEAAVAAQRALTVEPWPGGVEVRVRMGLHTGTPTRHAEGYVGLDVHKAARIAACAHGGQILVSGTTAEQVEGVGGIATVDLGDHQLKDLPGRTRIHQVDAPGLRREFATIRSLGAAGSLPDALTPILGRDADLGTLADHLGSGQRLVTLTGPGGTGKTRLSIAAAARVAGRFVDGVYFVPLAEARTALDMWTGIARTLEVPADGHIPPGFFDHVAHRRLLLVLDNLEQIDDAARVVATLLAEAPHVQILATTRRPLHLPGEVEHPVAPLPLPDSTALDVARQSGAVQLFVDHAARARPGFTLTEANVPDVVALCAALDGLPLALEIAAARTKLLSPAAILTRLDKTLDLTSTDRRREDRQRTVRGAIAWSYDLLGPVHRTVFDHLGVFEGGATLAALTAVLPPDALVDDDDGDGHELDLDDVLYDLLDASLLAVTDTDDGEPRITMLETIHRYAADRLAASDAHTAAVTAHSQYFYDHARFLRLRLAPDVQRRALLVELANFRALADRRSTSLQHDRSGDSDRGYADGRVAPAHAVLLLACLASQADLVPQMRAWLDQANPEPADVLGRAAQSYWSGVHLIYSGAEAEAVSELCQVIDRPLLDDPPDLPAWVSQTVSHAESLVMLVWLNYTLGRLTELQESLDRLRAYRPPESWGSWHRRQIILCQHFEAVLLGEYDLARSLLDREAELNRPAGNDDPDTRFLRRAETFLREDDLGTLGVELSEHAEEFMTRYTPRSMRDFMTLVAVVTGASNPLAAARAHGCALTYALTEGIPYLPADREWDDRWLAPARSKVPAEEWAAAFAAGRDADIVALCRDLVVALDVRV